METHPSEKMKQNSEETVTIGLLEHNEHQKSSLSLSNYQCSGIWLATLLAVSASTMFTASNYLVKAHELNTIDALLVRSLIQTVLLTAIAKAQGFQLWPSSNNGNILWIRIGLIVAAVSACTVNFLCYFAVRRIALGDAMALVFTSPLFTLILEWMFITRSPKGLFVKVPSAFLLIAAIILVVQPPWIFDMFKNDISLENINVTHSVVKEQDFSFDSDSFLGTAAALGAAVFSSTMQVAMRYISIQEAAVPSIVTTMYNGLFGILLCLSMSFIFQTSNDQILSMEISTISGQTWGWMVLVSSFSITGFWAQTASLRWIDASSLSALKSLEILFAYLVQIIVMEQPSNAIAIVGSALVMLAVIGTKQAEKIQDCFHSKFSRQKAVVSRV